MGGVRELVKHKFNIWDYMDELKKNDYILELKDGIKFYLPYCYYFDFIQMMIIRDDYFYEGRSLEYLKNNVLKQGMVIMDIGANIGNHTVFFAKKCQAAQVFSIEPQKDVFDILEKNVALNNLGSVCTTYNFALGKSSGRADIVSRNRANCGGTKLAMSESGDIMISALDEMDLPHIDFMKIDVEGFEYDVLKGGEQLLKSMNPIFYIEIEDKNFNKVNALLNSYGYATTQNRHLADYLYKKS